MASEAKILEAIFGPSIPTEKAAVLPEIMGHIRAIDDLLQGKTMRQARKRMEQAIQMAGDPPAVREGDVRCLKAIRGILQASIGPDTYSEELGCINRMIEAATWMEAAQG